MDIHPDISKAHTLPGRFYSDPLIFEQVKEKIFARSWLCVADVHALPGPRSAYPFVLLPGVLDEPLVLTCDEAGRCRCLSNVCTHRGMLVVQKPGRCGALRCGYHGRLFGLDGRFRSMPEFDGVAGFPGERDHLAEIPLHTWLGLHFVSLDPAYDFGEAVAPIQERIGWMPLDTLVPEAEGSADYQVKANWALYCDNFLEGFHIPFVHPALNKALDFKQYKYELFPYGSLQVGIAEAGEPTFDIPEGEADAGQPVYAYYFWLFPNLMLNFYPWGLSLNVVVPQAVDRTMVLFRTYRFKDKPFQRSANNLEQTEMEDEAVVEAVQTGVRSRYYDRGRYSPRQEPAVHHFHRLVAAFMRG